MSMEDRRKLAELVSEKHNTSSGSRRRAATRFQFPAGCGLLGEVGTEERNVTRFVLTPRDLSRGGMSVLHGGFVHPGVVWQLMFVGATQTLVLKIDASVVRCEHVAGNVHDVGLKFKQPLPDDFFENSDEVGESVANLEYRGRLAVIADHVVQAIRSGVALNRAAKLVEELDAALKSPPGMSKDKRAA